MTERGTIRLGFQGPVARLTLDNPRRRNALSWAMLGDLDAALSHIEAVRETRVVLLDAVPSGCFSAGADVTEWGTLPPQDMGPVFVRSGNRVFNRLAALDAISIALVGENAFGGGFELALAADFRLLAEDARLGFPETGIGAVPAWLGGVRLAMMAGPSWAKRVVLLGEMLDAATALSLGVADAISPAAALEARAQEVVAALLRRSPVATSAAKRLLALVADAAPFGSAHELAANACRASPDAEEGLRAFREKRPAVFAAPGPQS